MDRQLTQHKTWLADASLKLGLTIRYVCAYNWLQHSLYFLKVAKGVSVKDGHSTTTWRYVLGTVKQVIFEDKNFCGSLSFVFLSKS